MRLDPLTLSFSLALIYVVAAFALLLVAKHIKEFAGIKSWGLGALLVALGFICFSLRYVHHFESLFIFLSNLLQVIGFVFIYRGTNRFFNIPQKYALFYVLSAAYIPFIAYFTFFENILEARIVLFSLFFSVFYYLIANSFLKAKDGQGRYAAMYIGYTLKFMSAMLMLRFFVVAFSGINISFEADSVVNSFVFIIGIVVTLFFVYGLTLLVSQRLSENLWKVKDHFQFIFNALPSPIIISDKETGKIIEINRGFVNVLGYVLHEMAGKHPLETGIWKYENQRDEFFRQIDEKGSCYNYEAVFKNKLNEEIIALLSGVLFHDAGREFLLSVAHVITDMRKAEEDAMVLKSAVEQSPVSIIITNPSGLIEYVNPWFTKITGYTLSEVTGKNPKILKSGSLPHAFYANLWKTILSGNEWHGEFENRKKNGEIFWESASISGLRNDKGDLTHFVAVKEDITQRKIFDEELRIKNLQLNELNIQKDRMFSIISHDLRGPFNGLLGLTGIIVDEAASMSKEEIVDITSAIRKSAFNVLDLLNNLLDWSRNQQGLIPFRPEKLNVGELLADCLDNVESVSANKKIEMQIQHDEDMYCFADENMLKTILRNLASNAIKFTPRGGKIYILAGIEGNYVKMSIADSGIGMSPEIIDNLFVIDKKSNRVGTEKEPSTGLGLIICNDFVKKHGGEIWAKSKVGQGSVFYFTIPAKA